MESLTNFLENTKLMLSVKWLTDQKKHGDKDLVMVILDQFCHLSRFPEMAVKSQYCPEMAVKSQYCSIVIEIVLAVLGETRF